jgi:MoaA/NifB/PqqE/SkfB family radical SAM enzyme
MNLTEYMSHAIENIIQNALKSTLKNPKESAFLLKYVFSQKAAERKRMDSEKNGRHIPPFLIASITTHCNLFCKGCYARANHSCGEHLQETELSDQRWEALFEEAKELGVSFVLLAGGEPLLRREVIEKAAAVPEIIFPVFTNGTMMDETYLTLFDQNRNLIPVLSIEGNQAQTDARRGAGTYRILMETMNGLNQRGILYGASITVTTENLETVTSEDFIGELSQLGCKLVIFVEYVPVTASTCSMAPGDEERAILEEKQAVLREKYESMIFLSFPGDEKHTGGCLAAGRGFFHINAAGGAEPCPFSPYSDTNLKDCSLQDALQSPLFRRLNETGMLAEEHTGGCVLFAKESQVKSLIAE